VNLVLADEARVSFFSEFCDVEAVAVVQVQVKPLTFLQASQTR
jgi:hypothetical protein